jgi:plastocyanin
MPRRVPALFSSLATLGLLVGAAPLAAPGALAGGGCHADMTGAVHTDGPASVVRMDICSFEPTVARVAVGADVRFLNTSTLEHVVLGSGQSWGAGDTMQPGASRVERFGEAGVFPYSCPLHPGMVGTIVVGDANTPPSTMGAAVGRGDAPPAEAPAAEARSETAAGPATGLHPLAAVGLGGATGLAVLGLAALVVRRRPGSASIPG